MSSRNPMNERYTLDKKRGKTRKSAASAKPKNSAASSVVKQKVKNKSKTSVAKSKRARGREQRNKEMAAERKYGDPPTKRFKRLKKIWMGFLIAAIVSVALSFGCTQIEGIPDFMQIVFIILAYVFIIGTLYLDFAKIRKARRLYAAQMAAMQTKESRAEEKKQKAALRQAKKEKENKEANSSKDNSQQDLFSKVKSFFIKK